MRVRIYLGPVRRLIFGRSLKKLRFYKKKDESGKYYQRHIDDKNKEELKRIRRFCLLRFIRCSVIDDSMFRNSSYRSRFFKENKGIFGTGQYYLCAYCGKLLSRKKVRVDHIISVYLAIHSPRHKRMLRSMGIKNVNYPKNLAPSCAACNGKKGSAGGLWIPRGYFGKSWKRVFLSRLLLVLAGGIVLYFLYRYLLDSGAAYFLLGIMDRITYLKMINLSDLRIF